MRSGTGSTGRLLCISNVLILGAIFTTCIPRQKQLLLLLQTSSRPVNVAAQVQVGKPALSQPCLWQRSSPQALARGRFRARVSAIWVCWVLRSSLRNLKGPESSNQDVLLLLKVVISKALHRCFFNQQFRASFPLKLYFILFYFIPFYFISFYFISFKTKINKCAIMNYQ